MAVIIPQNITFKEWTGLLQMDWPNATIPNDVDDSRWKDYAKIIIQDPAFSPFIPQEPDNYAEPIVWIRAFSNSIY